MRSLRFDFVDIRIYTHYYTHVKHHSLPNTCPFLCFATPNLFAFFSTASIRLSMFVLLVNFSFDAFFHCSSCFRLARLSSSRSSALKLFSFLLATVDQSLPRHPRICRLNVKYTTSASKTYHPYSSNCIHTTRSA